nr:MAG TPA: hypothetical protein [Caudoviricetes sp.]
MTVRGEKLRGAAAPAPLSFSKPTPSSAAYGPCKPTHFSTPPSSPH